MSGGTLAWLTDNELGLLLDWYWHAREFDNRILTDADVQLRNKLIAVREEVACRNVPGAGRTLARDVG